MESSAYWSNYRIVHFTVSSTETLVGMGESLSYMDDTAKASPFSFPDDNNNLYYENERYENLGDLPSEEE